MQRRTRGVGAFPLALLIVGASFAADDAAIWHREVRGDPTLYRGSWTAAATKSLVVVGGTRYSAPSVSAFSVWAVRQADGGLAWENHLERDAENSNEVNAIATKGSTVVAAGQTETAQGGRAFSVVAYDAADGANVWQDHVDLDDTYRDAATDVEIGGRTAVAVGEAITSAEASSFVVRAYELDAGRLLWEDRYDHEPGRSDAARAVAVLGRRVFVAGETYGTGGGRAATIRAYDIRNGRLLWQDRYDRVGSGSDAYVDVVAARGKVFVIGSTADGSTPSAVLTRVYRATTGALLWEDVYAREGIRDDTAGAIASDGRLVVIGGRTDTGGRGAFTVRALSARDGALAWEVHLDRPLDASGPDVEECQFVALGRRTVYASGSTGTRDGGSAITVLTLRSRDGGELARDVHDTPGNDYGWSGVRTRNRLFVNGETEQADQEWYIPIRAYVAR